MKNKKLLIISLVVLVLAGAAGAYVFLGKNQSNTDSGPRKTNTVDYGPPKPTDKIGESSKDSIAKDGTNETDKPQPQKITVTISNTSQDSGSVYVRAITDGASSGECKLTMQLGETIVTKTAPINAQADYGICQGFNIPKSELRAGAWKVHLDMTSGNISGSADATIEVTI